MLPVELPEIDDFEPATSDDPDALPEPPLARAADWVEVELDLRPRGRLRRRPAYLRETNTMPQWAGSCWYYLRYLDPTNEDALVDPAVERDWADGTRADGSPKAGLVDLYVGGVEHAVLHLLYARFWHKVLFDLGHVSTPEPFQRLVNQGYILAAAYTDERGVYVEATEVVERDGAYFFHGDTPVHARVRQDGQEPEERRSRPTTSTATTAPTRCGSTRCSRARSTRRGRGTPPTSSACTASCSGCGATWSTRTPARVRVTDAPADDETRRAAAPHDRRGARRHGDAELQHRDRAAVRAATTT